KVIANKGNLASGTDLDNVIDIGTYRIGGLTGETDIINVPSERSGTTIYAYLTVSGTTTSVVQELIVYDSKTVSQIYNRSRSGSTPTFSPWSKTVMADYSGKVTIKDLVVTATVKTVNLEITGQSTKTVSIYNGGGQIILTRIGPMVQADIRSMPAIPANTTISGVIPDGYKPAADYTSITHSNNRLIFYANGSIKPDNNAMVSDNGYYSCSWVTKDATPTT
ncbi:pyocin knob domain-containing protein, partial [Lactococcus lactis]